MADDVPDWLDTLYPLEELWASGLTRRQADVLREVAVFTAREGYPPTLADLACHFGTSTKFGMACHVRALEREGYLRRIPGRSRGLVLADVVWTPSRVAAVAHLARNEQDSLGGLQ